MLPGKTYRVVGLRPNGDRIIVWEFLTKEDAIRLHEALIAKSTASSFVIEMDEYQSTVMPIEGALIGHQYLQRRRPQ